MRFSTYAAWWIKASLQDFVLRNRSVVRSGLSSGQKSLFFGLRRDEGLAAKTVGERYGVSADEVRLMRSRLSGADRSIDPNPGNDETGFDIADNAPLPDVTAGEHLDHSALRGKIHIAMRQLDDREAEIIRRRQMSGEGCTLEALGRRFGISKERVRQIEGKAMEKLRAAIPRDFVEAYLHG